MSEMEAARALVYVGLRISIQRDSCDRPVTWRPQSTYRFDRRELVNQLSLSGVGRFSTTESMRAELLRVIGRHEGVPDP